MLKSSSLARPQHGIGPKSAADRRSQARSNAAAGGASPTRGSQSYPETLRLVLQRGIGATRRPAREAREERGVLVVPERRATKREGMHRRSYDGGGGGS